LGATLVTAAAAIGTPTAEVDEVWVDGTIHRLVASGPAAVGKPTTTLYVIARVDLSHPLHPLASATTKRLAAHDHVIANPRPEAELTSVCRLTLTLPGAQADVGLNTLAQQTMTPFGKRPLLYAANLGDGMKPLTSAARIERARDLGLANLVVTPTVFNCTIRRALNRFQRE